MRVTREQYEEMVAHARADHPNECCGMVSRNVDGGPAVCVYRTENAAASPLKFVIEPMELFRVHAEIEDAGLELGAIYHSHTRSDPVPSQTDINFAAGWPGVEWIIVGTKSDTDDVRAFAIADGRVTQTELTVEDA